MSRFSTDLLRVIAVTYVVLNHSTWNAFVEVGGPAAHAGSWFFAVLNQLGKPSVLLFLFLSGFAFGVHPKWGASHDRDFVAFSAGFYRNRALRILPPYFLMSLVGFVILTIQNSIATPAPISADVGAGHYLGITGTLALDFAVGLLDGRHMFHLYFVALLCYLYLLFPWIARRSVGVPRPSRIAAGVFASILPMLAVYMLVDPHNRYVQSQIPFIAQLAPFVQAQLSGHATRWLILGAYALPFFIGGVRVGQYSTIKSAKKSAYERVATTSRPIVLFLLAGAAFGFVFGDFVYHVYATGQYPDSAGRIWRPSVVLYALLAVSILWTLTNHHIGNDRGESGARLRTLARLSFLVYLTHPLLQFAFSGLPFEWRVPLILGLAWPLALALSVLARRYRVAGILLGEGDRNATERSRPAIPLRTVLSTISFK